MNNAWKRLKQEWDANPMLVITVGAMAATAASKLISAVASIQSKRAYARRMNRKRGDK